MEEALETAMEKASVACARGPNTGSWLTAAIGRFCRRSMLLSAVVVLAACSPTSGDPPSSDSTPDTTQEPTSTDVGSEEGEERVREYEAAVGSAIQALRSEPGFTGDQQSYVGDYLASSVWFTVSDEGTVVVQSVDTSVAESAWWLTDDSPRCVGQNVDHTAWVQYDGDLFEVRTDNTSNGSWSRVEDGRGPITFAIGLLAGEMRGYWPPTDVESVESDRSPDEGTTWTVRSSAEGRRILQQWTVGVEGGLESWSWELLEPELRADSSDSPITSSQIEYSPVPDPSPIEVPDVGTAFEPEEFDMPDGLPLSPADGDERADC